MVTDMCEDVNIHLTLSAQILLFFFFTYTVGAAHSKQSISEITSTVYNLSSSFLIGSITAKGTLHLGLKAGTTFSLSEKLPSPSFIFKDLSENTLRKFFF